MKITFHEEQVKTALHPLKRKMPYQWDLNVYRGCQHGCRYCYALYSHKHYENENFYTDIHVKTNIVDVLEKQLSAPSWSHEIINIGGVTDCYQPAENSYAFMPEILKLLIKYKTPAIISTKSTLPLRDIALIEELASYTYVNIASSVTTLDERLRRGLEPACAPTLERFKMLKEFSKTGACTGLHLMPIIPYLTDSRENHEAIMKLAQEANVKYALPGVMYLKGMTRPYFMTFVKDNYPKEYDLLQALYTRGGAGKQYKTDFYKMFNEIRDTYGISSSYSRPIKEGLDRQLSFLDV